MAGPADAASLRLVSPLEPSRFDRSIQVGQAAHTCDSGNRESGFGPLWCSRLLRSMADQGEVWRRHAARADPARPAPPERGGEIFSGRADPRVVFWTSVQRDSGLLHSTRTGRSIIEIGSRSRDRVYTGSTRAPITIEVLCGLSAQHPRKHSTHPLQEQAQGSIGARPLATATTPTDSAAEQGLEAGSRQRSRRRGSQP